MPRRVRPLSMPGRLSSATGSTTQWGCCWKRAGLDRTRKLRVTIVLEQLREERRRVEAAQARHAEAARQEGTPSR